MTRFVGSITNRLQERSEPAVPEVGMGVTVVMYSDRHPGTISRVSASGRKFWYREDKATRTDDNGMSESQSYLFEPNPLAKEVEVTRGRDGLWRTAGGKKSGTTIVVGRRGKYHDFSF